MTTQRVQEEFAGRSGSDQTSGAEHQSVSHGQVGPEDESATTPQGVLPKPSEEVKHEPYVTPSEKVRRVAVIGLHGMGTQPPLTTLQGLLGFLSGDLENINLATLDVNGHKLTEAGPLTVTGKSGQKAEVYAYEAYYSPFLKGKASLVDAHSFLIGSAIKGSKYRHFRRFVNGAERTFPGKSSNYTLLLASFVSLAIFLVPIWSVYAWVNAAHATSFLALEGILLAIGVACAVISLGLAKLGAHKASYSFVIFLFSFLALFGLSGVVHFIALIFGQSHFSFHLQASEILMKFVAAFGTMFAIYSFQFLLSYAGDVVTYIFGHDSSKFHETRESVARRLDSVVEAVCSAKDPGDSPEPTKDRFDRVVIVGHSLGSVVGYDAINRYYQKHANQSKITGFLTYGSPLDKVAFIFRNQSGDRDSVRNRLISSRQPLLMNNLVPNQVRWKNIWAKHDIVSGPLDYYGAVENIEDQANSVPLKCHNEYHKSGCVGKALKELLFCD